MGFLKRLASLFGGGGGSAPSDDHSLYVYVRCKQCGEPVAIRVDRRNDLSPEWEGGGSDTPDYYISRKVFVGRDCCYSPVEVELRFDNQRRLQSQQVTGGDLLTEEEYRQAKEAWEAKKSDGGVQ
ncbi:MAG: hypothetical protein ACYC5O_22325 [Anaerolineae bacterium]